MKAVRIFLSAFALLVLSTFAGGGSAPAKPRRILDNGRTSAERAGFQKAVENLSRAAGGPDAITGAR